jgi:hypothetical protein
MADYIWVLSRGTSLSLGTVGISGAYIIPRAHVRANASELVGNTIWAVIRGEDDRLALVITAHQVDTILDGYYKDDFLLKPDLQNSLRIGATFNELNSYKTDVSARAAEGFSDISSEDANQLTSLLKNNSTVRLANPSTKAISNIIIENPPKSQKLLARMAVEAVVSGFNFYDIWSDGRQKKFREAPFASLAKIFLENQFPAINLHEIEDVLVSSDPYKSIVNRELEIHDLPQMLVSSKKAPLVDAIFKSIDPNHIFARGFSKSDISKLDLLEQIKKTEAAEHRHQEILRDVSRYLMRAGIKPFQSESVDLAYKLNGALQLFEIKTANLENAIAQASKGAFQLACYKNALAENYESIVTSLLLEDTGSPDLNSFILEAMHTLGIRTYFYNADSPWPKRLPNLPINIV